MLPASLSPDECCLRLKQPPTTNGPVERTWLSRGDGTFYIRAARFGPVLEMHVLVTVLPGQDGTTTLQLRFSGGLGSALLLILIELGGLLVFGWSVLSLATGGWSWIPLAGMVSILIPVLLVLALRASVPSDMETLTRMIASNLERSDDN